MISVIVPVYNAERYLEQCIDSICRQTYSDLEIILVDDGSTDRSAEICDEYLKKDDRIVVIHKENGGPVAARNAGLAVASGEYLAFVDSDDWIEPDMYERMLFVMESEQVDVVISGEYEDTGDVARAVYHGVSEGRYNKAKMVESIYPKMMVGESFFEWGIRPGLWDKLYRREVMEPCLLAVDERIVMGDDAASVFPCLLEAQSIYVLRECFYHYRQGTSSVVKEAPYPEVERMRFRVLYQSVNHRLERYLDVFDMRMQWKQYVLFLMTPRMDGIFEGFESLDYLFPFPGVKRGSRIVLYCAGTYGQRLYRFLSRTGFCQVVAWVDRNFVQFQEMGLPVQDPAALERLEFDGIVVANTYEKSRRGIYQALAGRFPEEKVHLIDTERLFSEETLAALGLNEGTKFPFS